MLACWIGSPTSSHQRKTARPAHIAGDTKRAAEAGMRCFLQSNFVRARLFRQLLLKSGYILLPWPFDSRW